MLQQRAAQLQVLRRSPNRSPGHDQQEFFRLVFRELIKDFFWMVALFAPQWLCFPFQQRIPSIARALPNDCDVD